ncbi:hypothetical protein A0J61_10377 [Choanephora cucurbitarum]|uniref:Uncharacterized protein n=1 Tax=Choanephora cucurbitarum TaxID=101091 RepID=A0A1C7N2J2_9FUNG|nr:hypothetical protein A0J61_10377 [Choanephora cucurbitarum]
MTRTKVVDDPMELDALDSRRGRFGHGEAGRAGNGFSRGDFGSRRFGNAGASSVEDQEVQLQDKHDDNFLENKNLIDLDPYSSTELDNELFPVLAPINCTKNMPTELLPIVYSNQNDDEIKYLSELNAIATSLPLYSGSFGNKAISILIDSGASENYVSPNIIENITADQLIPVHDRQVETAGGTVAQIEYKVQMEVDLNGFKDTVMAYVFPTKFDLILGRAWLKQAKPMPNWATDTWYLKNGSA